MNRLLFAILIAVTSSPCRAGDFQLLAAGCLAMAAQGKPVPPAPTPTPIPTGICDNCNGTGKLGDGTISVPCPVCDGTGKKKTTGVGGYEPAAAKRPGPSMATPPPVQYRQRYQPRRRARRGG